MVIRLPTGTIQGKRYVLTRGQPKVSPVPERSLLRFDHLQNPVTGETFPASFHHFYPLSPHDYLWRLPGISRETSPLMVFFYLTLACRDRCAGCFASHLKADQGTLPWEKIAAVITEFGGLGVKSIKFAGRESTISPHLGRAIELASDLGIASVLISGGDNLAKHMSAVKNSLTHFRISLNASNATRHQQLQNPSSAADDYQTRINNLEQILAVRRQRGLVSGATFLVRPDTAADIVPTARKAKGLGFDYFRFIFIRSLWENDVKRREIEAAIQQEVSRAMELTDENFVVWNQLPQPLIPAAAIARLGPAYRDPSLYLRTTVFADGKVAACPHYIQPWTTASSPGIFGNIRESSFQDIWRGSIRAQFIDSIEERLARDEFCAPCKYFEVNQTLRFIALNLAPGPTPEQPAEPR